MADGGRCADGHPRTGCCGTETDHVAPWRSVYKVHLLLDTEVTFVLNGGHNPASCPAEPSPAATGSAKEEDDLYVDADTWFGKLR